MFFCAACVHIFCFRLTQVALKDGTWKEVERVEGETFAVDENAAVEEKQTLDEVPQDTSNGNVTTSDTSELNGTVDSKVSTEDSSNSSKVWLPFINFVKTLFCLNLILILT